jgi:hypothetical protein
MSRRFAQGKYTPKFPEKYVGNHMPTYRSSWEWQFMRFCDMNEHVMKWASEVIKIPYRCPLTGKQTVYVPDFFIQYVDKTGSILTELIEVKPANQTLYEKVGKSKNNRIEYARNLAKWQAAQAWCKANGIKFRVLNEGDLFHTGKKR